MTLTKAELLQVSVALKAEAERLEGAVREFSLPARACQPRIDRAYRLLVKIQHALNAQEVKP